MYSLEKNHFKLLNLSETFDIDKKQLYQNYIKLQQFLHPDKLINKSNAEKILGAEHSAYLNNVYNILNDDKKRAEYLLSLHDIIINTEQDNVKPDLMMLAEILELSESKDMNQVTSQQKECWEIFISNYPNDLQKAAQAIIKLQYLNKI